MLGSLKLRTLLTLGNGLILGLMILVTSLVYINIDNLIETYSGGVDHTHKVIGQAANVLASAVDMETGMRGYLLAGKEDS